MEVFGILFVLVVGGGILYRYQRRVVQDAQRVAFDLEAQSQQLHDELNERDRTIADLRQETAKCDALLLNLRQQLSQTESALNVSEKQVRSHESIITHLRGQIEASERESVQSKALFSTISNVAYDLVFVLDEERTIIALNKSADALFGQGNPIGEHLSDVIQSSELDDIVRRALDERESLEEQLNLDGHIYRSRTQVMRYDGHHIFIGVALQDITQLVRLNKARREMVSNISHELRTPISRIRLIIDSLFHDKERPKRKASIASLKDIARETDSLFHVVEEIYDLSRIESGQAIMKLVDVRLLDVVDEVVESLTDQLEDKQIHVVRHVPDKMHTLCDRDHTRRMISNLLRNAIKYSPKDDHITISAMIGDHEDEVVVSIFDNGVGVPPDQVERIFERFYQVDPARTGGDGAGSGLGLAICKHIVEAQGGQIWVEDNSQGGGGRFFFTLLLGMGDSADVVEVPPQEVLPEMDEILGLPDADGEGGNGNMRVDWDDYADEDEILLTEDEE